MTVSDFRSDTVTKPSAAMRAAMASAKVGDDVLDGDPTVRRLERRVADLLGKEDALFVPSGTMANQVAVGAWTSPGGEVVVERDAHVVCYEAGALAALHGVQCVTLTGRRGALDPDEVRAAFRPDYIHCPRTQLVCVEQTHMAACGRVVPLEELEAVHSVALEAGVPVHLDGARLFNAVVASGVPAERWGSCAETVSVCLSKGLGAPVGSLLAGAAETLARARVLRKRFGGWMRQAGVLAACGLHALEHNVERLVEDHALALELAGLAADAPGLACDPNTVETNIVMAAVEPEGPGGDAYAIAGRLEREGVRALPLGPRSLRFMTHSDVGREDLMRLAAALKAIAR